VDWLLFRSRSGDEGDGVERGTFQREGGNAIRKAGIKQVKPVYICLHS
jgi:hypothetical protein